MRGGSGGGPGRPRPLPSRKPSDRATAAAAAAAAMPPSKNLSAKTVQQRQKKYREGAVVPFTPQGAFALKWDGAESGHFAMDKRKGTA